MIEIHTDGSFVHEPFWVGAWAYVIYENALGGRRKLAEASGYGGRSTNGTEAMAIVCALSCLRAMERGVEPMLLLTDSDNVKRVIDGDLATVEEGLMRLGEEARRAISELPGIRILCVKRYEVRDADRLAGELTLDYRRAAVEWHRIVPALRGAVA